MRRGRPPYPDLLTPREQEVLQLLREGLTNQQIADRLGISLYGARYHVSEILSKLGVSSRDEAAAWRGERLWGFVGIGPLLSILKRPRWEVLMKGTPIALLAGVAGLVILLTTGAVLVLTSGSDSAPDNEPAPTAVASNDPEATPEFGPPLYREYGPYRIAPLDHQGDTSSEDSPLALPQADRGSVASNIEEARASSLFPQVIPEGYEVAAAGSDGQPSEIFLRVVFEGPHGPVTVVRTRPLEMPIDYRYDPSLTYVEFAFMGSGGRGFAVVPDGGDRDTTGGYIRGMENGIDTAVFGAGVSVNAASEFYRAMTGRLGETTREDMLPPLVEAANSLPRPEDVRQMGPCDLDLVVTPNYAWSRASEFGIAAWMTCEDLVPLAPCAPGSVWETPGLEVACDADGYRIDTSWTMKHPGGSCRGGRPAYVEGMTLLSAVSCLGGGGGSGTTAPVEVCVSVRDRETCAEFDYLVP